MYRFGNKSARKLLELDCDLQLILNIAIKLVDFSIIEGHRDEATQDEYYFTGKSKVQYPGSKHNKFPSLAVDIAPFPYPKTDYEVRQAYFLTGLIKGIAHSLGIKIRVGCDWNADGDMRNDKFQDVWHIEKLE